MFGSDSDVYSILSVCIKVLGLCNFLANSTLTYFSRWDKNESLNEMHL